MEDMREREREMNEGRKREEEELWVGGGVERIEKGRWSVVYMRSAWPYISFSVFSASSNSPGFIWIDETPQFTKLHSYNVCTESTRTHTALLTHAVNLCSVS